METKPGDTLNVSLTELVLRRMVVSLWNETDTLSAISKFELKSMRFDAGRNAFLNAFEADVRKKVLKLVVPAPLQNQMLDLVRPIGLEIRAWKRYHETKVSNELDVSILKKLYWTSLGSIDFKKSAEEVVRCEVGDVLIRYNLACLYCLEEYVPSLWEELPGEIKNIFYNKEELTADRIGQLKYPYQSYLWSYIVKGETSEFEKRMSGSMTHSTFNVHGFIMSLNLGNKAATEYFFNKLNHLEKAEHLVFMCKLLIACRICDPFEVPAFSPMEKLTEVLCYLLSVMTPEERMERLKEAPIKFFRLFLDWPWYDIFPEVSSLIWNFLPIEKYEELLRVMKIAHIRSGYFIPKLFQEFFIRSPESFKKHFLHESCHFDHFLCTFFDNSDSGTIRVVFRNVNAAERMKLVNTFKFYNIFDDLIMADKWHLVKFCLQEARLSKENREVLKKTYMDFLVEDDKPIKPTEWKRFFQLLDEIDASVPNKRSSVDETPTGTKKFCSENQINPN